MRRVSDQVYQKIDNSIYDTASIGWWRKDLPINLMETILNPVRTGYFKNVLSKLQISCNDKDALEIGCGGGILCEEIAGMGFKTTGIDPSGKSLEIAVKHAKTQGLSIKYLSGKGEQLPFSDQSFDVVFCCDVLEHVRDPFKVIGEISRVLKKDGLFFFDTMNRTILSRFIVIKIMQEWKYFALLPAHLHVWEMFIRPEEMKQLLRNAGIQWKEQRGINLGSSGLRTLKNLYLRAAGKISCEEFAQRCRLREGAFMKVAYMGYAIK